MHSSIQHNRRAWDDRVHRKDWYIDTATESDFNDPWAVLDPCGWLERDWDGRQVLCLAAGGGRHGVLFASLGARVTVVDLSPAMLALDQKLATERGLNVRLIESSMDNLSELGDSTFDLVFQPVSTCYVPDIAPVYREVARVTRPGALYISQHKQPLNLQAGSTPTAQGYPVGEPYHRSGPVPPAPHGSWHRESGTVEFLHRWDQLLGGLCTAGFVIENVAEPRHGDPLATPGSFAHRSAYIPPYIRLKARRTSAPPENAVPKLWVP